MPLPIMKTKQIGKDTIVTMIGKWEDTSFDHEFGRKVQGHYEVTHILINGVDVPLEILDHTFLEEMDSYVNQ